MSETLIRDLDISDNLMVKLHGLRVGTVPQLQIRFNELRLLEHGLHTDEVYAAQAALLKIGAESLTIGTLSAAGISHCIRGSLAAVAVYTVDELLKYNTDHLLRLGLLLDEVAEIDETLRKIGHQRQGTVPVKEHDDSPRRNRKKKLRDLNSGDTFRLVTGHAAHMVTDNRKNYEIGIVSLNGGVFRFKHGGTEVWVEEVHYLREDWRGDDTDISKVIATVKELVGEDALKQPVPQPAYTVEDEIKRRLRG